MKFGAVICLYDDHEYLEVVLSTISPYLDYVLFLMSDVPWNGVACDNSETIQAVSKLAEGSSTYKFLRGHWQDEIEQRNCGLSILSKREIDYCFIIDSDEVYHDAHFRNILNFIQRFPQVDAFHIEWNTYWTKDYYRIWPRENFKPLICVKVNHFAFNVIRGGTTSVYRNGDEITPDGTGYNAVLIPPDVGICYHLSYARSDEYIKRKLETNSHAKDFIPDWYEKVWARWTPGTGNLHPIQPQQYEWAIPEYLEELPPPLQKFIEVERGTSNSLQVIGNSELSNEQQRKEKEPLYLSSPIERKTSE